MIRLKQEDLGKIKYISNLFTLLILVLLVEDEKFIEKII